MNNISGQANLPLVEVVTLAYNSERFIDGYFNAFSKLNYPTDKLVINIIDNHPDHRSFRIIEEKYLKDKDFPFKIRLEKSVVNSGFTGGNNIILRRLLKESKAPYYMLINIDTEIERDCIKNLVNTIMSDRRTGMLEALQKPREHPKVYDPVTFETGWCSCGGVLIDSRALREVGLFDERFFLYCEDVDLSWRMWQNGWKCKIEPRAAYIHHTEDQDKGKDLSTQHYFGMRNGFYMHFKYDSRAGIRRHFKLLEETLAKVEDEKIRAIFVRARDDAKKARLQFLWDRFKLYFTPRSPWILFNEFSFEKRRKFVDTEDGKRIILS